MDQGFGLTESTVAVMKSMAVDALKCAALVHDDTCLGGLIMVLSNKDSGIVIAALETLQLMADWPEHRSHLKQFLGMTEQLNALMRHSCSNIQDLAWKLHYVLWMEDEENSTLAPVAPLRDTSNTSNSGQQQQTGTKVGQKGRRNSMLVRSGLNKGKSIVLQIRGMNDKEDADLCRSQLLKVKGVISITFDLRKKRSILRTRPDLNPELLAQSVARTFTMSAEQVVKDDDGNEMFLSFKECNKENEDMPDYPEDDEESPIRGDKNMTRMGGSEPQENKWGFLKSVGEFISTSFYW